MPSTFHGFSNLSSLQLDSVVFGSSTYGELFSRYSLLEMLSLCSKTTDDVKVLEVAKLENLRELRLHLRKLDYRAIITSFDVLQHMSLLSKLHELNPDLQNCKVLVKDKERFQTLLPCLKALKVYNMDCRCANLLSLVYAFIFASRNAMTLDIIAEPIIIINGEADYADDIDEVADVGDAYDMVNKDCHKMGMLHLRKVSLENVTCSDHEVLLLKSLLSSSPLLKEMKIDAMTSKAHVGLIKLCKKLLKHRASSIADINILCTLSVQ